MPQPLLSQLKLSGIIAILPGDLPLQSIIPAVDALLAAPVSAVMVALADGISTAVQSTAVLRDIRQRAGSQMVVGAEVETTSQTEAALAAGAQFISTQKWDTAVSDICRQHQVLHLPGVMSLIAASTAEQRGYSMIRLRTGGIDGPDYVSMVQKTCPNLLLVVDADINPDIIGSYGRAGATAVLAGQAIFTGPHQPMADIISRARSLQKAWEKQISSNGNR
jgi:2-keto-3-deoxy-6-phosphogluconate aldolase